MSGDGDWDAMQSQTDQERQEEREIAVADDDVIPADVSMLCPYCRTQIDQKWQGIHFPDQLQTPGVYDTPAQLAITRAVGEPPPQFQVIWAQWMRCPNEKCWKPLIRISTRTWQGTRSEDTVVEFEEFIALPRWPTDRPVSNYVPESHAADFVEAATILERSPRGSAAISRRLLADILTEQGYAATELSKQIDLALADPSAPKFFTRNLDHLREIGNFATHTQKSTNTGEVIAVEPGEAEWVLDVLDTAFQHYYVNPAIAAERRAATLKRADSSSASLGLPRRCCNAV